MAVEIGQPAPPFTLRDQNNELVSLEDFRGSKNVVLVFYPLAFTRTCQNEMCAIRDDLSHFENDDVQVLAISVDSAFSHKVWADQEGFTFPLLADFWPHGEVAQAYGCFDENRGQATRGTFIIDKDGVLRWALRQDRGARDQSAYLEVLSQLP
jgi:mycoredoxin-dependent peroxiredoxin